MCILHTLLLLRARAYVGEVVDDDDDDAYDDSSDADPWPHKNAT